MEHELREEDDIWAGTLSKQVIVEEEREKERDQRGGIEWDVKREGDGGSACMICDHIECSLACMLLYSIRLSHAAPPVLIVATKHAVYYILRQYQI